MASELQLLGTEILLQSVMDTVQDGVTVIDRDLKVVFHNEAIRRVYGSIAGQQCFAAYRGRTEPCPYCTILDVLRDGQARVTLEDTRSADGRVLWVECSCGPLQNASGEIVGAVEIVRNVTDKVRLTEENATLRREVRRQLSFDQIVTQSKTLKKLFRIIERVAPTTSPVLLSGESGTGKELFAKAIWQSSDRRDEPFVPVNCATIPRDLLESELFGHAEGAFTGATRARSGLIEQAAGGTLFLDEIGELPLELQPKLLRFLQDGEVRRVGEDQGQRIDVRVLAATNRDLDEAMAEGVLREDLYYRLAVIPMYLPPLRERREDVVLLATHLMQRLCDEHRRSIRGFTSAALETLLAYPWPGNVRELENTIEYAIHLADDEGTIDRDQLPPQVLARAGEPTVVELSRAGALVSIEEYARQAVISLQEDHNEERIAQLLGISRKTLWEKRKRWDLPRPAALRNGS